MRLSLAKLNVAIDPNLIDFIKAVGYNNARGLCAVVALTDSSTGVAGAAIAPILTQTSRVGQSGTNLASRSGFNTAIGTVNNALAVLATFFNTNVLTKLGVPNAAGFNGTVATPGTIAAMTKTVTGVDGSGGDGMLRSEANAAIVRARNNLSTIIRLYNISVTALGGTTMNDLSGGSADPNLVMGAGLTASTAVAAGSVASSDLATKASVDAALTALANNVARVAAQITANIMASGVLSAKVPHVIVP